MILDIELVSDFTCPWCFLGTLRLEKALTALKADRPGVAPRINWLPFFLNPDTPSAGIPYRAFVESKFGGPAKINAVYDRIAEAAADDGLKFDFARIRTLPNTLKAHRLMYRAQALGRTPEQVRALAHALFAAHFQEGRDIGDSETLADIAAACGDRRDAVLAELETGEDAANVQRMAAQLRRQGIEGVPFFIFNRKLAVSGAQSAAVLGAAILQSLEAAPAQ